MMNVPSKLGNLNNQDDLHSFLKLGLIGFSIVSPARYWIEVNDRLCRILGYTRKELLASTWDELTYPDDLEKDVELFDALISGKKNSYDLDKRYIRKDGTVVYATISVSCQRNNDGTVKRIFASVMDISERKKAEDSLREREECLELFFSQSLDGFYFMMLDEPVVWNDQADKDKVVEYMMSHERMIKVNDALVKQYKSTREQFLGLTPNDFYAHDLEYGKRLWRQNCDCIKMRIVTDERRMDGSQMFIEGDYTCIFDAQKRIVGHFGIQRDITSQKLAGNTLRESEERYRTVFKTNPDAISITTLDGVYIDINEGFICLTGFTQKDVIGFSVSTIGIWTIATDRLKMIEGLKKSGVVKNLETIFHCHDGSLKTGLISASIININNEPCILSITKDISERKIIENELIIAKNKAEQLSRLKSSLLMNMSHELRTPLNGILGFSSILGDSLEKAENKYMADIIYQSGTRLMGTLNSIIELAQVEADRTVMEIELADVGVTTKSELKKHQNLFEKKRIRLITTIDDGIYVKIDKTIFGDILYHLLDNAVKFTEKGSVHVSVSSKFHNNRKMAILKVKDTGIGISKDQMEYIFDTFRQGDEGIGRCFEGNGIGLSLCRKFTNLMGGSLEVESQLGQGSVFTLYLPFSDEKPVINGVDINEQKQTQCASFEITHKKRNKLKVLIVEDNQYNCDLTAIYLKNNCIADKSYTGKSALNMALQNDYDIILMDINLGQDMDGIMTGHEIRKMKNYSHIPIIAVTGYTTHEEREYIMNQGFNGFLSKPFTKQQLLLMIDQFSLSTVEESVL
ncbi:MAG: PAS domain S-box protein [Bacteroidales bacterium]|nr:PAS domain S-box protein [Bacteroidales bacterium]